MALSKSETLWLAIGIPAAVLFLIAAIWTWRRSRPGKVYVQTTQAIDGVAQYQEEYTLEDALDAAREVLGQTESRTDLAEQREALRNAVVDNDFDSILIAMAELDAAA